MKIVIDKEDWDDAMKIILLSIPSKFIRRERILEFNTEAMRKKILEALNSWVEE